MLQGARSATLTWLGIQWSLEMTVIYCLVGYDKLTEGMVFRRELPAEVVRRAKEIARIPLDDDTQGDCPLDESQVKDIAGLMMIEVPADLNFLLEPYVYA